jgi:hypothetical protein
MPQTDLTIFESVIFSSQIELGFQFGVIDYFLLCFIALNSYTIIKKLTGFFKINLLSKSNSKTICFTIFFKKKNKI